MTKLDLSRVSREVTAEERAVLDACVKWHLERKNRDGSWQAEVDAEETLHEICESLLAHRAARKEET